MRPRRRKRSIQRESADGALSDSTHSHHSAQSSAPIRRCLSPEPRASNPEALAYLHGLLATPEGADRVLDACAHARLLPANLAGSSHYSNLTPASAHLPTFRPITQPSPPSCTTQPRHLPDRRQPTAPPRQQGGSQLPAVQPSPLRQSDQQGQTCQPPSAQTDSHTATPQVTHSVPSSSSPVQQPRSYRAAASSTSPAPSATPSAPTPTPTAPAQPGARPRSDPVRQWEYRRHFRLMLPRDGSPSHEVWRDIPLFRLIQGGDFPIQDWLRRTLQYPSLVLTDFRK